MSCGSDMNYSYCTPISNFEDSIQRVSENTCVYFLHFGIYIFGQSYIFFLLCSNAPLSLLMYHTGLKWYICSFIMLC